MRILVGGSLHDVPRDTELCREFVAALGREIVKQGHVLLNGCRGSVDKEIATAAQQWLCESGEIRISRSLAIAIKAQNLFIDSEESGNHASRIGRWTMPS
jgi:predicted Rossmann-fold nucleotide-binding protein